MAVDINKVVIQSNATGGKYVWWERQWTGYLRAPTEARRVGKAGWNSLKKNFLHCDIVFQSHLLKYKSKHLRTCIGSLTSNSQNWQTQVRTTKTIPRFWRNGGGEKRKGWDDRSWKIVMPTPRKYSLSLFPICLAIDGRGAWRRHNIPCHCVR